ncbi:MAG: V-type ATP synthase subunit A, partial [Verrucomicrobia bacterium]|nr:V-type ATP synthase subunit A [Verrucomicrobiota bacterium]
RRYPAIDPLDSWSKYDSVVDNEQVEFARRLLREGSEVNQMMKVVGEEGTSIDDFVLYLKSEYVDSVYLQQDAFHDIDAATPSERQAHVFQAISKTLKTKMSFADKDSARHFFQKLTQTTKDWNRVAMETDEFKTLEGQIEHALAEVASYA